MKRQGRADRKSGVTVRLTARDQAVLRALGRFRIARTSDLARYGFREVRRDTAAARLRRLFDAGYLAVRSRGVAEENLYSLGTEGRDWLRGQGQEPGTVPHGGFSHHLAIVTTWVDLAIAVQEIPEFRLCAARPDWELRKKFGTEWTVVPDLLVRLTVSDRPLWLSVEVDLGTEWKRALRKKFCSYAQERDGGTAPFAEEMFVLALVVNGGARREQGLVELVDRTWRSSSLLWRLDDGPNEALLRLREALVRPLADSPCRKGREDCASDDAASTSSRKERGLSGSRSGAGCK